MPTATDLIVKNGASTPVDKTFTLLSPAAGDGQLASWALQEGAVVGAFPQFTSGTRKTPKGRLVTLKYWHYPSFVNSVDGQTILLNERYEVNITVSIPDSYPVASRPDASAFATNLVSTALIKAQYKDGLPATS